MILLTQATRAEAISNSHHTVEVVAGTSLTSPLYFRIPFPIPKHRTLPIHVSLLVILSHFSISCVNTRLPSRLVCPFPA